MTKKDLIDAFHAEHEDLTRKEAAQYVTDVIDWIMTGAVTDGEFRWPGFMTIKVVKVKAKKKRWGMNPFTKEEQWFKAKPASKKYKFRALKAFKEMI